MKRDLPSASLVASVVRVEDFEREALLREQAYASARARIFQGLVGDIT